MEYRFPLSPIFRKGGKLISIRRPFASAGHETHFPGREGKSEEARSLPQIQSDLVAPPDKTEWTVGFVRGGETTLTRNVPDVELRAVGVARRINHCVEWWTGIS